MRGDEKQDYGILYKLRLQGRECVGVLHDMRTSFEEKENTISGRGHSFYDEKDELGTGRQYDR